MNLTQILILLLQLLNISRVSELSGETQLSHNIQIEVYSGDRIKNYFYLIQTDLNYDFGIIKRLFPNST